MIYNDKSSSFEHLLGNDISISIHKRNLLLKCLTHFRLLFPSHTPRKHKKSLKIFENETLA